jgi:hypothetical protein
MKPHRSKSCILFAALLSLAGTTHSVADEPAKPKGERFALLVGVEKYNDPTELKSLQFAEEDVTELAKLLEEAGYRKENIMLMTQKRGGDEGRAMPESAKIRQEMTLLLKGRKKDDSIVIAFTGHGVQFQGAEENYFCPMDAKLADKKTLIPLQEIYKELEKCEAGLKVLLVDACRDDPRPANSRSRDTVDLESVTRPPAEVPSGGVAAFFSCSAGQRAFEDADLKHGVFFYHVIQGLRGAAARDGAAEVYLGDLEFYVNNAVEPFVRHKLAQKQQPQLFSKVQGKQNPLVAWPKAPEPATAASTPGIDPRLLPGAVGPTDRVNLPGYASKDHKIKRVIGVRQITNHRQAEAPKYAAELITISDDGAKIAWYAPETGLWTANFDGSASKLITPAKPGQPRPVGNRFLLSPDGRHLFWQDNGGPIVRIGTDGEDPRTLTKNGAEYTTLKLRVWGNRIFYGTRGGLYSVDTEGVGDIKTLLSQDDLLKVFNIPGLLLGEFDTSERGTEIVCSMYDPDLKKRQLYRFPAGGDPQEDLRLIVETEFEPMRISVSPDGRRVFFGSYAGSSYIVNWDGSGLRELKIPPPRGETSVRFTPDGRWISYFTDSYGSVIANIDTGEIIDVIQTGLWDGSNLAMFHGASPAVFSRDLRQFLYVMNFFHGPMPRQLVAGEINPRKADGLPGLSEIAFPRTLSFKADAPNHSGDITVKVTKGAREIDRVQFVLTPHAQYREQIKRWDFGSGWYGLRGDHLLHDDGQNGDAKAADGVWSTNRAGFPHVDSLSPGRFQLRVVAHEKSTFRNFEKVNAVIVDVEGIEVK